MTLESAEDVFLSSDRNTAHQRSVISGCDRFFIWRRNSRRKYRAPSCGPVKTRMFWTRFQTIFLRHRSLPRKKALTAKCRRSRLASETGRRYLLYDRRNGSDSTDRNKNTGSLSCSRPEGKTEIRAIAGECEPGIPSTVASAVYTIEFRSRMRRP